MFYRISTLKLAIFFVICVIGFIPKTSHTLINLILSILTILGCYMIFLIIINDFIREKTNFRFLRFLSRTVNNILQDINVEDEISDRQLNEVKAVVKQNYWVRHTFFYGSISLIIILFLLIVNMANLNFYFNIYGNLTFFDVVSYTFFDMFTASIEISNFVEGESWIVTSYRIFTIITGIVFISFILSTLIMLSKGISDEQIKTLIYNKD